MSVPTGRPATRARRGVAGTALAFVAAIAVGVVAWRFGGPPPPQVQFAFERATAAGTERLAADALLHPGDRLSVQVRGAEPLHVVIVNEDAAGVVAQLFPYAALDRGNPLPGGEDVRLPGTQQGQPFSWEVTSRSGRERFVLLARSAGPPEPALMPLPPAPANAAPAPLLQRLFPDGVPRDTHAEEHAFEVAPGPPR